MNTTQTDNTTEAGVPDGHLTTEFTLDDRFHAIFQAAQDYIVQQGPDLKVAVRPTTPADIVVGLLAMVNGLSLYGAAIHQLILQERKVTNDKERELQDLLCSSVIGAFGTEQRFCHSIEQMHRHEMLKAAGVDSSDEKAVFDFFKDQAEGVFFDAPELVKGI